MFSVREVAQICHGTLAADQANALVCGVAIDSREVQEGDLFAALKGTKADGHDFARDASRRGAVCALLERDVPDVKGAILVPNVLNALQRLARFHRARFSMPVIGVTGSVGKTTTKECIGILLSEVFRLRISHGNWNNQLGVPLNLLRLSELDQCLVIELGANHPGEIAMLAELAEPTVGVITGVHPAHLEGFGSLEGVYRGKMELADYLSKRSGTVIAYGDDLTLVRRLRERACSVITFGTRRDCDFFLSRFTAGPGWIYFQVNGRIDFRLKGYGFFNAMNALGAIATAAYFRLDLTALSQSWRQLPSLEGRFACEHWDDLDLLIVDDAYNASPRSFEQGLASFEELAGNRRKLVIAGDMLELGSEAIAHHEALGRRLADLKADWVIGVGPLSRHTIQSFLMHHPSGRAVHADSNQKASEFLQSQLTSGDALFIKGSHALKLEEIKQSLKESFQKATAMT